MPWRWRQRSSTCSRKEKGTPGNSQPQMKSNPVCQDDYSPRHTGFAILCSIHRQSATIASFQIARQAANAQQQGAYCQRLRNDAITVAIAVTGETRLLIQISAILEPDVADVR